MLPDKLPDHLGYGPLPARGRPATSSHEPPSARGSSRAQGRSPSPGQINLPTFPATEAEPGSDSGAETDEGGPMGRPWRRAHMKRFQQFCHRFEGGQFAVRDWAMAHLTAMHWGWYPPPIPRDRPEMGYRWWVGDEVVVPRRGRSRSPRKRKQ